ncbi:peptide ABC transporter substrate-binding protein [Kineosporia succinea]|uniref:Oligopeptide transport system substrate-binding protein n=1 Tax=Kineosporia succinea TaxID=84632 RepID=A0ABT9NZD9_9ACTN|nr:ABC transporter substrate-binding protein [Kineosporia succinea]MDP9825509.1 oligopeptide transport system substrate-binding protein [Kineosporia succinea]
MKQRRLIAAGALFAAGALALSACSSDSGSGSGEGSTDANASITIYSTKPQNPLVPGNTNEVGGGNILDAIFRGLVDYDPDTAAPEMSMAESIESTDNKTWTIKLKAGQTFQDGTPVDADSFINAWNWTAYGPNAALNNYFFASFDGYADMNTTDPDDDGPKKAPEPKAKELTGLKKVSDTEFTATLAEAQSFFPTMVGYTAFYPLPKAFFDDPEAYGKKPVANGPFQITAGDGDTGFTLTAWSGYKGEDKPKIAEAVFKTYTSDQAGYSDVLAGNLDFMNQVPAANLVDDQYQTDRPDHFVNKAVGVIQTTTLPQYDDNYKDNPDIGKALSLAIDRDTITKNIFNGGRTPATGWVSPIVDGYKADACGEFCTYDPAKAKEYLAKSKFKGPFTYSFNNDGPGNKEAAEAICNSIKTALEVECTAKPYADFATLRADVTAHKMDSLWRTGWQMDYPHIQNFLEPLYATGAGSNDGLFSSAQFDDLIKKANAAEGEEAYADYQAAEKVLAEKMTIIPLWYQAQQSVWSDRLSNVKVTPKSTLDLTSVTAS